MKLLLVARKTLLETLRELQLLGLTLVLPVIFVAITAFSYNVELMVIHPVLVLGAEPLDPRVALLLEELRGQRHAGGRPVFDLDLIADREEAEAALSAHEATLLLTIAPDEGIVTVYGDALYPRFYPASTIVNSVVNRYADRLDGRPEMVQIVGQPLFAGGPETEADLYAPGMIVFALLLIIPQTAMLVSREMRRGTLRRLRLSQLRAWEFLGGICLSQMAVALVQVVLVLWASLALGLHLQGSLGLSIVVGLVLCFSAIGPGLVVAAFSENDSQAANVGSTIAMLQVFLSGSFYQFPPITLFTLSGHQVDLFDILPATHGFLSLQQVLAYEAGLGEIGFRLAATLLLSVLYFALGVVIFQRRQMRRP